MLAFYSTYPDAYNVNVETYSNYVVVGEKSSIGFSSDFFRNYFIFIKNGGLHSKDEYEEILKTDSKNENTYKNTKIYINTKTGEIDCLLLDMKGYSFRYGTFDDPIEMHIDYIKAAESQFDELEQRSLNFTNDIFTNWKRTEL